MFLSMKDLDCRSLKPCKVEPRLSHPISVRCRKLLGVGILVNPYEIQEINQAMEKLLEDEQLCQELSKKGLEQAKKFSWQKTATVIIEACV